MINQLVEDGILTEEGYAETSDGKKVSKYTALFEKVRVEINTKGLVVQVLLRENILNESQIVCILPRSCITKTTEIGLLLVLYILL